MAHSLRSLTALPVCVACLLGRADALAQDDRGSPDPGAVEPPKLVSEEEPKYPDGATGESSVIIEIIVEEDGSVTEAVLVEGVEPLATAALDAARRARFEPARRGGRPVRARIRIAMKFTPPPPPELSPPASPTAPPVTTTPPPVVPVTPPVIEEVVITGRRPEPKTPTEHRMGRAEMRVVPGAFGDPFRAIDILPGVVPIVSGLPYFYVRGAPPSAVGYYVDEIRVPYLFHFALGPSVIQPALIDEVALHPAAFPARYGRYAGGIVSGVTRDPAREIYGEAQIRIYDAGGYVEAPFAGGRGTVGLGGRYSYTAGLFSLLAPGTVVDYRDYNARASYDISDRWRVSAFTFGSFDYAAEGEGDREQVLFASEFHRLDLRFDRRGADSSTSRIATTIGFDRTRLEDARSAQNMMAGLRGRHRWPVSRTVEVELGADALADFYGGDLPHPYSVSRRHYEEAVTLFAPRTDTATGAWASATYKPARGWDLTGTFRGDVFTSAGKVALGPSPRVSMRVPLASKLSFVAALGIAPQPPAFAIPVPAVGYRGLPGGLAFAYQKSAGTEVQLPWKFTLKTSGFHHSYFNLRDFSQSRGELDFQQPRIQPSSPTQAYGLELLLMRKLSERFAAFASATISRAQIGSTRTEQARISPFDRTYVAQVGGVADLGRNWRASSRFLTYAGWPGTHPGEERLPSFFRVDLRIEKRWVWQEHRYIGFVMEGLNVTGSEEVVGRSCVEGRCENQTIGPIIVPSIGVEGAL
jgi:TonB family protein